MNKTSYDDIINKMGYFRTKASLSLRETSIRLGYNPQFMKTIENRSIELKLKTFLDFCEVVNVTPDKFFQSNYSLEDEKILNMYNSLSLENKNLIISLMKNLK